MFRLRSGIENLIYTFTLEYLKSIPDRISTENQEKTRTRKSYLRSD